GTRADKGTGGAVADGDLIHQRHAVIMADGGKIGSAAVAARKVSRLAPPQIHGPALAGKVGGHTVYGGPGCGHIARSRPAHCAGAKIGDERDRVAAMSAIGPAQ